MQYLPGPTTGDTIEKTSEPTTGTGTIYDFTIGAKVDATQPAGTYFGSFTFTATANFVNYNITFDCGNIECSPQTGTSTETSVALRSQSGDNTHQLLGYCTKSVSNQTCKEAGGIQYKPGSSYPLINNENNIKLFAMWAPTTMQSFGNYCDMMEIETDTLTLTDIRDNNNYKVRKLKDGKCWMIQNLRLGDNKLKNGRILTKDDTDITTDFTLPSSNNTTFKTYTEAAINTDYVDQIVKNNNNGEKYGTYYNWLAATAGTGTSNIKTDGDNASGSICPKGWGLPKNNDAVSLIDAYRTVDNLGKILQSSEGPNFILGGNYNTNNSADFQGNIGQYWTSTSYNSAQQSYLISVSNSGVGVPGDYYRDCGRSVRCVSH